MDFIELDFQADERPTALNPPLSNYIAIDLSIDFLIASIVNTYTLIYFSSFRTSFLTEGSRPTEIEKH